MARTQLSVVLVLVALVGMADAAPARVHLPAVFGDSLASALAPQGDAMDGASFSMDGAGVALLEECEVPPVLGEAGQDVLGASVSVAVPVLNPHVTVKVAVDGKLFALQKYVKLAGSVAVQVEINLFSVVTLHAGVTGTVLLNSKTHNNVVDMVSDLARYVLASHEKELHAELARFFDRMDEALSKGEAAGHAKVDEAWDHLREFYGTLAEGLEHSRDLLYSDNEWRSAYNTLEVDGVQGGVWSARDVPLLYKTSPGVLMAAPFHIPLAPAGDLLDKVLADYGVVEDYETNIAAEAAADVGAGTVAILVLDCQGLPAADEQGFFTKAKNYLPEAYVRFTSDIDTVDTRVVESRQPVFFDEVRVAVGNRRTHRFLTVHINDEDVLSDDVLAELSLDLSKLVNPYELYHFTLKKARSDERVTLVARWMPFTERDAFADIGLPDAEGFMHARVDSKHTMVLRRRATGGQRGSVTWEWGRFKRLLYPCSDVEQNTRGAVVGAITKDLTAREKLLCNYLARARPALPTDELHVGHLLKDIIAEHVESVVALVEPAVQPLVDDLSTAMSALHKIKRKADAFDGHASDFARAIHTEKWEALDAMGALLSSLKSAQEDRAAFGKYTAHTIAANVKRLREEMAVVRKKTARAKLAESAAAGDEARVMLVDFAYFFQVGGQVAVGDFTAKATAGVAGHGVRGTINSLDFTEPATKMQFFDLALGGVELAMANEWKVTVTGLRRKMDDATSTAMLSVELQAPGDAIAERAFRSKQMMVGPGTGGVPIVFEKMLLAVRVAEAAVAGSFASAARLAGTALLSNAQDALVKGVEKKVKDWKLHEGAVARTITPGVVLRMFLRADVSGKWTYESEKMQVIGYVMDKTEVSLKKALGPVGDAVDKVSALELKGVMETGVWWPLNGVMSSAPHLAESLFHI